MAKLIFKGVKLETELVASIQDYASLHDTTFSKLVRECLKREFGLLREVPRRKGKTP